MKKNKGILISLIAGVTALSGCGDKKEAGSESSAVTVSKVTLYSWSEYFAPEAIEAFTEETGIEVDYVSYDDGDELEAQLLSDPGRYDVVVTDDYSIDRLSELQLLGDLDSSTLSNLSNVDPRYLGKDFDRENNFSTPYTWGTILIAYRTDKVDLVGDDWGVLDDPALRGKVMVLDDRVGALGVSLLSCGHTLNSQDPSHISEASDKLVQQITENDLQFGSDSDVREGLESGSVWLAVCFSGDAAMIAEKDENIAFFIPKAGAPMWMDNFAVAASSKKRTAAHQFINFMLSAEQAAANANFTWYATTNAAAKPFINDELLADKTINPAAEVLELCRFFAKPDRFQEERLNAAWGDVQDVLTARDARIANTPSEEPGE